MTIFLIEGVGILAVQLREYRTAPCAAVFLSSLSHPPGHRAERATSDTLRRLAWWPHLEAQVKERNAAGGASADAECERLQAVLGDLSSKEAGLGKEVQAASACDPERYRKMKEGATTARDSANRWIENIWPWSRG